VPRDSFPVPRAVEDGGQAGIITPATDVFRT
jgi:hypothetical protein